MTKPSKKKPSSPYKIRMTKLNKIAIIIIVICIVLLIDLTVLYPVIAQNIPMPYNIVVGFVCVAAEILLAVKFVPILYKHM